MILIDQVGNNYEIRFKYDPTLVDMIKEVPTHEWHPDKKCWTLDAIHVGFFLNKLKDTPYEKDLLIHSFEEINKNYSIDDTNQIPEIDISDVDFYVQDGFKLFKHQIDTIKYDKWRNEHGFTQGFILADMPGLAKTCSVLNVAMYHKKKYGAKHCLVIVCVNTAKYNWVEDIKKHSNGKIVPYLLGTRKKKRKEGFTLGGGKEKFEDLVNMTMYGEKDGEPLPYFIVMNIEAIQTKLGRTYILANRLVELIRTGEIGVIALDEVHLGTSPSSKQGKLLLELKSKTEKQSRVEWIPMTGTPITSKPTDVFTPLYLVGGHTEKSFYMWCQNYCVYGGYGNYEIVGYKNIQELKHLLQPNMLRRKKENVLDLPPKIHHTEYVENTQYQQNLYNRVKQDVKLAMKESSRFNIMVQMLSLRQVNGSPELVDRSMEVDDNYISKNAKLQRLLQILDEIIQGDEKAIIFSNWVEPLRMLYKFLTKNYKVCCCTGTMTIEDREKHKRVFMNNPEYKLMIGTVGAMGTSHTLTAARNVIFYDSPWNPSEIEQCEDRCHRAGTTGTVNVYTLITKDTVDEVVHDILSQKQGTADFIVDNELDPRKHPEIVDLLLQ